jgi:hypothetical protein
VASLIADPIEQQGAKMKMSGGCPFGQARYSAEAEPVFVGVCHCRNCQRQAGSGFSIVLTIPKPAFSVAGALKTFSDRGDSGKAVSRRFCPECGSPIISECEALPDLTIIKAGTLDDTSWLKPTM